MITDISSRLMVDVRDALKDAMRYVSLHSDVPDFAAGSATELSFGGYTRQIILWKDRTESLAENLEPLVFSGLKPPTTIVAIGLNRTSSGSELMAYGLLPKSISSGLTSFTIPAGELVVRIT